MTVAHNCVLAQHNADAIQACFHNAYRMLELPKSSGALILAVGLSKPHGVQTMSNYISWL